MALPKFNHPWVDETHSPIFISSAPPSPTNEEFNAYLARLDAWTEQAREHYVWVIRPAKLNALQRKALAESQTRRLSLMQSYQLGVAFVIQSAALKSIVSAVFLFAPPPVPHLNCTELSEALNWAKQRLDTKGSQ